MIKYNTGIPALNSRWETVLQNILTASGVPSVLITSTLRSTASQAAAMYTNAEKFGAASLLKLYGSFGRKVVGLYTSLKNQGKDKTYILTLMTDFIKSLGPANISHHLNTDTVTQATFDVWPDSIPANLRPIFEREAKKYAYIFIAPQVGKGEPVYHIEFNDIAKSQTKTAGVGVLLALCGIVYLIIKQKGIL